MVCQNLYKKFDKTLFKISSQEFFTGHKNITWKYERMIYSSFQICALSRTSNKYRFVFFRNSKKKYFNLINYYCTMKIFTFAKRVDVKKEIIITSTSVSQVKYMNYVSTTLHSP